MGYAFSVVEMSDAAVEQVAREVKDVKLENGAANGDNTIPFKVHAK